jgi:hypothetical protein
MAGAMLALTPGKGSLTARSLGNYTMRAIDWMGQ